MLKQRLASFKYAFKGLWVLISSQSNAKIHLLSAILVISAGFYFHVTTMEWCILIFCICSVIAAEGFNTALEFLTDLVSPDFHPLAEKTKDVAAAAVLVTAIGAAVCGVLIFMPKIIELINN